MDLIFSLDLRQFLLLIYLFLVVYCEYHLKKRQEPKKTRMTDRMERDIL